MEKILFLMSLLVLIITPSFSKSKTESEKLLIAPPKSIKYTTMGYHDIVADSLWLRVIQDLDFCGERGTTLAQEHQKEWLKSEANKEKIENSGQRKFNYSQYKNIQPPKCRTGWVYEMLDTITELSPDFRAAYVSGAAALSIMVDDRQGAAQIYDKAIEQYPTDWPIAYQGGYHWLIEMREPDKAARYLQVAADNGAPEWVYSLLGRIYNEAGQAELTLRYLQQFLENNPDYEHNERILERIAEAQKILNSQ